MWQKLLTVLFLFLTFASYAQPSGDHNLAIQYYRNGEFEKAASLFEELYEANPQAEYYYRYYYNCLIQLEAYKDLEKMVKKAARKNEDNPTYTIDLGYVYLQQGEVEDAYAQYDEAIEQMEPSRTGVIRVANAFNNLREYDYAVKAYVHGQSMVKDYPFYYELANLYRMTGNATKMVTNYLDYVAFNPQQRGSVQNILQDYVEEDGVYREMQRLLYERIQEQPKATHFNEMLIWLFMQRKDFSAAFVQAKALDRRLGEDGMRIYNLAKAALEEQQYDAAIKALDYLVSKGRESNFYFFAKERLLEVKKEKITEGYTYNQADLKDLQQGYKAFLQEFGNNKVKSAYTLKELAELEAYYFYDLDTAIAIMEDLVYSTGGLSDNFMAECKLDLGDYYLIDGEIWEATLLYSQVDKRMKDEPIGELARFKNAKLAYYRGDFDWAQTQLDVLKGSTSELIANDALDLSVFITSNLGLDTTLAPMLQFARADLLMLQNKTDDALQTLDSIVKAYPGHLLLDDIYFLKAEVMIKRQDYETAVKYLEQVTDQYNDKLLLDDAYFMLGQLYEEVFEDDAKAMEYYQTIILDHKDSVFVIEARERFRALRGDKLN